MNKTLLEVQNLKKGYPIKRGWFQKDLMVHAVNDVSFTVKKGETFGLVGESGCGKSTTGRTILRLIEPTSGSVYFDDTDISQLSYQEMRALRRRMQMVFQDPSASLNPKKTIKQILMEPLKVHKLYKSNDEILEKVIDTLKKVGLSEYHLNRYPHEFSGGQRQRIGIARAVILEPDLIIADEPVSALDVSIQSQILNLLVELQKEMNLAYIFISHDLDVVRHISDRVAVMYLGNIVEMADTEDLFKNPKHPYTKALMSAVPISHPDEKKERIVLKGDAPNPINPPTGCPFHPRCPVSMDICKTVKPPLIKEGNHEVSCHLVNNANNAH